MKLFLNYLNIYSRLACAHCFHVGHVRMFLTLEDGVNLLECLAFGLHPVDRL